MKPTVLLVDLVVGAKVEEVILRVGNEDEAEVGGD